MAAACRFDDLSTSSVIAYAALATAGMVLVALLGLPTVCAVLALLATVGAGALLVAYWPATEGEVAGRAGWERPAVTATICALPLVAAAFALLVDEGTLHAAAGGSLWLWRGLAIDATVIFGVFYLSSLVDWCYIVPRLCGLGAVAGLPCQSSTMAQWFSVTRVWLAHRIAAYLVGRVGGLTALGMLAARFHPQLNDSAVSAIATIVAALIVYYVNHVLPIGGLVTNPPIQVGDKVILAEEYGTGVKNRPVYYIVDVAIEGVKLLELDEHDQPFGAGLDRGHDRSLGLADVGRLLRSRQRFHGCDQKCCRASKYCPLLKGEAVPVADALTSAP